MKTKKLFFIIFAFILSSMIAKAQGVTNVIPIEENIKANALSNNGHYIVLGSEINNSDKGEIIVFDANNNNIVIRDTISPGGTGTNWGIVISSPKQITINNNGLVYISYIYHSRSDNKFEYKLDKLDINTGNRTNIFNWAGGGFSDIEIIDNKIIGAIYCGSYGFDPGNTNIPNMNPGEGFLVAFDLNNHNLLWTQPFTDGIYSITKTYDGMLSVTSYHKRWRIDPNNGTLLGSPMVTQENCRFEEDEFGYVTAVQTAVTPISETYNLAGNVVANTDLGLSTDDLDQFQRIPLDIHFYGNTIIAVSASGESTPAISIWKRSLVNPDEYYDVALRSFLPLDDQDIDFGSFRVLEVTDHSVTCAAVQTGGGNFYGTNLTTDGWVVYTYNFDIDNITDFSMNDIHSPTNNINHVYGYGRYENGVWTAEDTGIAYIIYNSDSNIPDVGTVYPDNGAWNIPSDMNPIPSTWINHDFLTDIRLDDDGNKFFYVWALGTTNINEQKAVLKVMLLSDGSLDVINNAMSGNTESSLSVSDYENIQVTGVTASNLDEVNTALAGVNSINLPLTVAEIQALVDGVNNDTTPPNASALATYTLYLDANGNATLSASDIDNGSTDNVGIVSYSLSQSSFDCSDVGSPIQVVLTVTDDAGNSDTATTMVTVIDNMNPILSVQDIDGYLDASGNYTIDASSLIVSMSDNCSIASTSVNISTLDCTNVGDNSIDVSISDTSGNTTTETAVVHLMDNILPTAAGQDIQVDLAGNASVSITAADIDNGSSDNCGVDSMSVSPETFTATGNYDVVLTVSDASGNSGTTTVNVEVIDSTSAINETQIQALKLYPNPVTDRLVIVADEPITDVIITDITGKQIWEQSPGSKEIELKLNGLTAGIYIVSIKSNKAVIRKKIVKK